MFFLMEKIPKLNYIINMITAINGHYYHHDTYTYIDNDNDNMILIHAYINIQ